MAAGHKAQLHFSPGEAKLYAIGQGTSEALYIRHLITEAKLAKSININIHTDSAVGKSVATRFGTNKKTMHVELRFRYVQELVGKEWKLRKVGTKSNCADVLTKYLDTELRRSHVKKLCVSTPTEWFELWSNFQSVTFNWALLLVSLKWK